MPKYLRYLLERRKILRLYWLALLLLSTGNDTIIFTG